MNRFEVFKRLAWSVLVVCAVSLGMSGCEGDDGRDGAAGAAGAAGPAGPAGPEGPAGPGASIVPLESCAVCHGDGSFADAAANHALPPIESVSNIAFAVNGADLDVTFDLAADEAPAEGYDVVQRAYRNNGTTRTDVRDDATLTDNGGGNYTITIAGGAAEAATNNRWLFRVQNSAERETRTYFYADNPASPFAADVSPVAVDAEACANCHGPEGIPVHGSAFIASDGGEVCLSCHGAERPPDDPIPPLFQVAHGYHNGIHTWEDPPEIHEITYPTYMNNCSVCHQTVDQLANVNAMPITPAGCFSCHGSIAGIPFVPGSSAEVVHTNIVDGCEACHAGQIGGIPQTVADVHNGAETGNDGIIWDGVDTSVKEGELFDWRITDIVDDGVNLAISWQADYDGVGVDPCNDDVANGPVFFVGNTMRAYRSYAQGDDFILGQDLDGSPGEPDRVTLTVDNTTCAAGVATTTIPVDVEAAERGRVVFGGKPQVLSNLIEPAATVGARVPSPAYDWLVGDGEMVARRYVVDTKLCLGCHVGSLYQHGGDRVDNVDMCLLCHNAAANEQDVRVGMGVDASEAYDGKVGQAYELKTMLHRIHSANWDWNPDRFVTEVNPPFLIYRNRGIYAFAGDESQVPNWPGDGDDLPVFGSDDGTGNPVLQDHHFHSPTFPRSLNECTACHTVDDEATPNVDEDFMVIPDQTKSMASTVDVGGTDDYSNKLDDVLQGAATTACITCHYNSATKGHAYQNSWEPQEFPEGRQTIIDAAN